MTCGDLITFLAWGFLGCLFLVGFLRMRRPARVDTETATSSGSIPRDHVELVLVFPKKVQRVEFLLDGNNVGKPVGTTMTIKTTTGTHLLTPQMKFVMRSNHWNIECPENGRYEVHFMFDRIMGGFQNDIRIVKQIATNEELIK